MSFVVNLKELAGNLESADYALSIDDKVLYLVIGLA